jgi:hypothetical protein
VFDTYDRLVELAEQTQFTLKRFKKHMDRAGIEPIKEELLSFHTKMIEFCLLARKVYKRRSWSASHDFWQITGLIGYRNVYCDISIISRGALWGAPEEYNQGC